MFKIQDEEAVICLYNNGKSMAEIAKIKNTTPATILALLRRNNIKTRLKSGTDEKIVPNIKKQELYDLYWGYELSLNEIARLYDLPNGERIRWQMEYYGISRRNYKQAGKVLYSNTAFYENVITTNRRILHSYFKNKEMTSIERIFADWCDKQSIDYDWQYQIPNASTPHCYDFFLTMFNLIVEIDGDYWHSTEIATSRDLIFDTIAEQCGYKIKRFKGSDIKATKGDVFDEIFL